MNFCLLGQRKGAITGNDGSCKTVIDHPPSYITPSPRVEHPSPGITDTVVT